ncbi:HU family DNA-binding protein [soil metagenome]
MNKAELIEAVQAQLGDDASKKDAQDAVAAVLDSIAKGIKDDQTVQVIGFGTFKVSHRAARKGRNPKTGEEMTINASKGVRFSPSTNLKASL